MHESTGKYPNLEQAKRIRQQREEKTLTKEIVRLLVIGERKKKTTVTLKQDERSSFLQSMMNRRYGLLYVSFWRNGAIRIIDKYEGRDVS